MSSNAQKYLVVALLILSTCAVYGQVLGFEFINLDDDQYVTANPHVRSGLTVDGLIWAFTGFGSNNWHPLTWLSHMLDVQLFGLAGGSHHATSLLLHIVNSVLLFHVLMAYTRKLWPAAAVAALFALHPAHVESVAWVSERKDVLSTFFFLLTLHAYNRYCNHISSRNLALVCLFFAMGLMSKPMLVTLPFVLLLLDVWPLQRLSFDTRDFGKALTAMFKEKLPLFALVLVSIWITIRAQAAGGAMKAGSVLSLHDRLDNALISYARYLAKAVYPTDLAIYYPHPGNWEALCVFASAGLLLAITGLVVWRRRAQPYLAVGWFWFVGTLVPVIGLLQVGSQSMADRYTYVSYVGLFIAVTFALSEWLEDREAFVRPVALVAVLVIVSCGVLSWQYTAAWKNTVTVFTHSLTSTDPEYLALVGRGPVGEDTGVPAHVGLYTPYYNLGTEFAGAGLYNKARLHFEAAIEAHPGFPEVYINMGVVLAQQGDLEGSARYYRTAIEVDPGNELAAKNLSVLRRMMR